VGKRRTHVQILERGLTKSEIEGTFAARSPCSPYTGRACNDASTDPFPRLLRFGS